MIFVDAENKLKYDTDRMELISDKVKMEVGRPFRISVNAEIYRSKKGRWLGVAPQRKSSLPMSAGDRSSSRQAHYGSTTPSCTHRKRKLLP